MAVKGKLAKSKRNNQKRNKLVKQGKIVKTKKLPAKPNKQPVKKSTVPLPPTLVESDDDPEDMLGMVEDDDLAFLQQAVTNKSYSILNKIRYGSAENGPKPKRRKTNKNTDDDDENLETVYEDRKDETIKVKNLLPIKTKHGLVPMSRPDDTVEDEDMDDISTRDDDESEGQESDDYHLNEPNFDIKRPITTAAMLAARNEMLRNKKIHIGTLSAGLLENPEEKASNFRTLLDIMTDSSSNSFFTVQKLALVSLLEVFKDLLPLYQIKEFDNDGIRLKKDTLKLQKYEAALIQYYKSYLQKLEKFTKKLTRKKGDSRKTTDEDNKFGEMALQAMCDLLVSHSYFNFAQNIAQVVVPYLNHRLLSVRKIVNEACKTIFKQDKKGEITLNILRMINQYLRKHTRDVHLEMLDPLLALRIRDINLDHEKEQEIKQKKLSAHKQKIIQMTSRNEKKRKKRLQEVEQEMLETKAEENKQTKQKNFTEITKVVFGIYFRILKSTKNTKILGISLEGLAKFTHCINLEFYTDLVNVLSDLLNADWLGDREQLHCILTVLIILSGQGEVLNIDPTRFYTHLYKNLLTVNADKNQNASLMLGTLTEALIKRRKKITVKRMIGFIKRICTQSLHLNHNGTLSYLGVVKNAMQLCGAADVLLDLDTSVGDGKYLPELDDPDYCNASSTALYELILLTKHYNPAVIKYAKHIAKRVPASGEGSLPPDIGKCTPQQLYEQYDLSVGFNPPIPKPKKYQPKAKANRYCFNDSDFKKQCFKVSRDCMQSYNGFYINFKSK